VTTKKAMLALLLMIFLAASAFGQEQAGMKLTLEDSILMALKNNLNLAVEVYNPELADATLSRAREFFLPSLDFNYDREGTESPSYWFLQGSGTSTLKMTTISASVVQQVPWGGNVSMSLQNYKSDTNQAFQLINPRYGSTDRKSDV
jgi:outer membrane protein TolC